MALMGIGEKLFLSPYLMITLYFMSRIFENQINENNEIIHHKAGLLSRNINQTTTKFIITLDK